MPDAEPVSELWLIEYGLLTGNCRNTVCCAGTIYQIRSELKVMRCGSAGFSAESHDFSRWECVKLPHSHLFQVSYMSVPLVGQQTFRPCGSNPFSVWSGGLRVTGRKTTYCDTGSIPVSGTWRVRSSRQPYILCLVQTPYCASHRRIWMFSIFISPKTPAFRYSTCRLSSIGRAIVL